MFAEEILVDVPRYVVATVPQVVHQHHTTVLVIGGGAAGLAAALRAAAEAEVIVLARGGLRESNSAWAQGGIAAALDSSDSPHFHVEDTLIAGAGLSDLGAVEALAWEAPDLMRELAAMGVPFERHDDSHFALGLEGGHSQRRIVHVGDTTGWAVTQILIERASVNPRIRILEGYQAVDLLSNEGQCTGVLALDSQGGWHAFHVQATILATGGAGALYGLTSNQPVALGEGIALAYRAGAEVADMEFVQFHPTVLRMRNGQGFLISEAARGEGGRLLTLTGERFMPSFDPRGELAPRDVVTRGIFAAMQRSGSDHVLLDLTHLGREYLAQRFPTIYSRCCAEGIDPAQEPIPVAPAAHYLMGGIRTDLDGATNIGGLYAAGECACTGVHGANRLASNSLLECLVFGRRAGAAALDNAAPYTAAQPLPLPDLPLGDAQPPALNANWREDLATLMRRHAGPRRSTAGLEAALQQLEKFPLQATQPDSAAITAANAALSARLVLVSAWLRKESRGAHFRSDFPHSNPAWLRHIVLARGRAAFSVETIASDVCAIHA